MDQPRGGGGGGQEGGVAIPFRPPLDASICAIKGSAGQRTSTRKEKLAERTFDRRDDWT